MMTRIILLLAFLWNMPVIFRINEAGEPSIGYYEIRTDIDGVVRKESGWRWKNPDWCLSTSDRLIEYQSISCSPWGWKRRDIPGFRIPKRDMNNAMPKSKSQTSS
jgi:hypothetical protein